MSNTSIFPLTVTIKVISMSQTHPSVLFEEKASYLYILCHSVPRAIYGTINSKASFLEVCCQKDTRANRQLLSIYAVYRIYYRKLIFSPRELITTITYKSSYQKEHTKNSIRMHPTTLRTTYVPRFYKLKTFYLNYLAKHILNTSTIPPLGSHNSLEKRLYMSHTQNTQHRTENLPAYEQTITNPANAHRHLESRHWSKKGTTAHVTMQGIGLLLQVSVDD